MCAGVVVDPSNGYTIHAIEIYWGWDGGLPTQRLKDIASVHVSIGSE